MTGAPPMAVWAGILGTLVPLADRHYFPLLVHALLAVWPQC